MASQLSGERPRALASLSAISLVPTLQRGNECPGAPAPRNRPLERTRLVTTLERGNQKTDAPDLHITLMVFP